MPRNQGEAMKKILSLALAITVSSLALISLPARSVRAQEVASAGKSIGEIKEEYERLLRVERDPSTPEEVKELNRKFLEERRTQLRAALEKRLGALRNYQSSMNGTLSADEGLVVSNSIQALEKELSALAGEQKSQATAASTQRARLVGDSSLFAASTTAPNPAQPNSALPTAPVDLQVLSPDNGTADTFDLQEIKLQLTPSSIKTPIDSVEVKVENGGKAVDGPKTLSWGPSDFLPSPAAKKVNVKLADGSNDITVTVTKPSGKYDPFKKSVTFASAASADTTGHNDSGHKPDTDTGTPTACSPCQFTEVPVEGTNVRVVFAGSLGPDSYQFFVRKKDGTKTDVGSPVLPDAANTISAVFPELDLGDIVGVVKVKDGQQLAGTAMTIAVASPIDITKGGPFGLLLGGAVISQQNQEFQQADPFFGFIAGYDFKVHGAHSERWYLCDDHRKYIMVSDGTYVDGDGYAVIPVGRDSTKTVDHVTNPCQQLLYKTTTHPAGILRATALDDGGHLVMNPSPPKLYSGWKAVRLHVRFQGIFQADARATTATATASPSPTPITSGVGANNEPTFTFLASRKTFDVETHAWLDLWANNKFTIGPYAAFGASTVLSKTELAGETATNPNPTATPSATPTATPTASPSPAASPSTTTATTGTPTPTQSENDMKKYYEFGLLSDTHLFNNKLFIQSILAYGHYEAFAGLSKKRPGCSSSFWCDSQNRFVGKLRIFPEGLNLGFGRQLVVAPMFGVDLNAGRGPDYLKFFTGFAVRIKGFDVSGASPPK
jgi:hypothetical protein